MATQTPDQLQGKTCKPCEGGVEKLTPQQAKEQIIELAGWKLTRDGNWIEKKWAFDNFQQCLNFLNHIGEVAETEQHHPDLHLEGYKTVRVEISTHAIGGLSENDFILAAKIDGIDVKSL